MATPASTEPLLDVFLAPVTVRNGGAPRAKHEEICARAAEVKATRSRKRLRRAVTAAPAQSSAPAEPGEGAAFDRQGYAAFLRLWSEELAEVPDADRETVEIALRPYFAGKPMGGEWREIVSNLCGLRAARVGSVVEPRRNDNALGAPLRGGW